MHLEYHAIDLQNNAQLTIFHWSTARWFLYVHVSSARPSCGNFVDALPFSAKMQFDRFEFVFQGIIDPILRRLWYDR